MAFFMYVYLYFIFTYILKETKQKSVLPQIQIFLLISFICLSIHFTFLKCIRCLKSNSKYIKFMGVQRWTVYIYIYIVMMQTCILYLGTEKNSKYPKMKTKINEEVPDISRVIYLCKKWYLVLSRMRSFNEIQTNILSKKNKFKENVINFVQI